MREFTKADWDSYAGCDSENPSIGNTTLQHKGESFPGEVIVDGTDIQIFFTSGDVERTVEAYLEGFPNKFAAEFFASRLIEDKDVSNQSLEMMGFDVFSSYEDF